MPDEKREGRIKQPRPRDASRNTMTDKGIRLIPTSVLSELSKQRRKIKKQTRWRELGKKQAREITQENL
jgi:hypothetical protein